MIQKVNSQSNGRSATPGDQGLLPHPWCEVGEMNIVFSPFSSPALGDHTTRRGVTKHNTLTPFTLRSFQHQD